MHTLTIAGLGLSEEQLTLGAIRALESAGNVLLRTARCGAAQWLKEKNIPFCSLDELYERAEDFDRLNEEIVSHVRTKLKEGDLLYGVIDLRDESVALLLGGGAENIRLLSGVPVDGVLAALSPAPCASFAAADAEIAVVDTDQAALVREISSRTAASEIKLRLMERYPDSWPVTYLNPKGELRRIPLCELDRQDAYDHRSAVYAPRVDSVTALTRFGFRQLNAIVKRLRAPGGCPWDIKQTHESLRTSVVEEAYEVVDAINRGDMDDLYDELGDLLLQVSLHAEIARQHGEFTMDEVTGAVCKKMIHRHQHVFGSLSADTAEDVLKIWEDIKQKDRGVKSQSEAMRAVSKSLPALTRAAKVQKKAAHAGFDWDDAEAALPKIIEEAEELKAALRAETNVEEELGDLLFSVVNVARLIGIDAEIALTGASDKFMRRFSRMEALILKERGAMEGMTLSEMDAYWERVKAEE